MRLLLVIDGSCCDGGSLLPNLRIYLICCASLFLMNSWLIGSASTLMR